MLVVQRSISDEAAIVYCVLQVVVMIVMLLASLGDSLHHAVLLDVVRVVGLNISGQAVERPLKCVF